MTTPSTEQLSGPRGHALVRYLGHSTLVVELDGVRILTDPILRGRVTALMRRRGLSRDLAVHPPDAVLISHMHHDHLDIPSLERLGMDAPLLVPRRAGSFLSRRGFRDVRELHPGDAVELGGVRILATSARHTGFRVPFGPWGGCLGFVIEGTQRIYFAGDTDLFPGMGALGLIDLALLPIAGWGPVLVTGHLNPVRAARALQLIRPRVAVPIHWGTLAPIGMHLHHWPYLIKPPRELIHHASFFAPEVQVRVLEPGDSLDLAPA
ncbi:MAG: MBL fold metallo-hydrolase [Chloroflexota bacterium]